MGKLKVKNVGIYSPSLTLTLIKYFILHLKSLKYSDSILIIRLGKGDFKQFAFLIFKAGKLRILAEIK